MEEAIKKETVLKRWNRAWKIELIETKNPEWKDLYEDII
jgi:putative endonuclease